MAKKSKNEVAKKSKNEVEKKVKGEQEDLCDVQPENAKALIIAARTYKKWQVARTEALAKEIEQKQLILELVGKANLQRLKNGVIKCKVGDVIIRVTPRDDLVQISEKSEKAEGKAE